MIRQSGRRRSLQALSATLALAAAPRWAFTTPTRRCALVLGIARYGIPANRLRNPAHDAERMAQALRARGIEVTVLTDLTGAQLREAVSTFARQAHGVAIAVVYFAGHAVSVDGVNYLFGVDLPVAVADLTVTDAQRQGLSLRLLSQQLQRAGAHARLVFIDACRTPLTRGAVQAGLVHQVPAGGELIAYATQPGATAEDGFGADGPAASPYAFYLAAALQHSPGAPVEMVLRQVTADVQTATARRQIPHYESSLVGEVSLDGLVDGHTVALPSGARTQGRGAAPRLGADLIRQRMSDWEYEIEHGARQADAARRQALAGRAAVGDVVAMTTLGLMAESGVGQPIDLPAAADWYAQAAEQDFAPAKTYLGEMAAVGNGIPRDLVLADRMLREAADAGHTRAQLSLLDLRMRDGKVPGPDELRSAFESMMQPWVNTHRP